MPKRKRQTPTQHVQREFKPVIPAITDAPGPEADADELAKNYRLVQEAIATHAYEDHIILCHWCLADKELTHTKVDYARGVRSYCSERCAQAYAAYMSRFTRGDRPMSTGQDAPLPPAPRRGQGVAPTDDEAPPPLVAGGANGGVPVAEITEVIGEEGQGRTATGDAPAWKPKGQRPRKSRNGNGNGNGDKTHCLLGHDMTEENTYHHPNGTKKCRQCQRERLARMRGKS